MCVRIELFGFGFCLERIEIAEEFENTRVKSQNDDSFVLRQMTGGIQRVKGVIPRTHQPRDAILGEVLCAIFPDANSTEKDVCE